MAVKKSEIRRTVSRAVKAQNERSVERPVGRPTVSIDPSPFSRRASHPPATQEQIAVAAYYRAMARGFEPGHDTEDWLAAERELEASRGV